MCALKREEILNGIYFNSISDERFKTNQLMLYFVTPLRQETAAMNALIPNLLRKGYDEYPDFTQFNRHLDELYGAYADGSVDKMGDSQTICLSITAIDDKFTLNKEALTKEISKVLSSMALKPVMDNGQFVEKEVALEKETLIDTINAEINDKRTYAVNAATRLMCRDEPYGLSKYGTVEQAKQITAAQVTKAYQDLIKTARVEIMFAGCGSADTAKEQFIQSFRQIERDFKPVPDTEAHQPLEKPIEQVDRMDVSQSKMVMGFATGLKSTDELIPALRVMCAIFGGTPMSKLFLNVREKLSLCYYCASRLDRTKGLIKVDSGVENQNIEKAREEILNQLEEMKKGNITDEEIRNAVMSLENSYRTINDSNGAVASYYLGEILTDTIRSPEEEAALVKKVTKEQIIEAANLLHFDICYVLTGKEGK